jgi:glycosyltransferase involved in cell wall biosynthesis
MKVLVLSYEFPPLGGGGAKVVHGLAKEMVRLGHEVDIVTMGFRSLPKHEKLNGTNIYRVPCLRTRESVCSTPEMVSYALSAIPFALRLIKSKHYDINHTHFIFPDGLVSYLLKKITNLPYIITAHGSDVPNYNPDRFRIEHKILSPLWKKIVADADRLVCLSETLKSLVNKHYSGDNISVIPNGIDIAIFQPIKKKHKRILIVSRMFERKGIQYFMKALDGLELDHEVNIVGDGPYLQTLKQMVDGQSKRIKFWGWLEHTSSELKALYETSSIFVFPSESENFPIALLEAMAAGLAIITTKNTGCEEVVGDCAILVERKSPLSIKKALQSLLNDADKCSKLGQDARKRLEDNFGWNKVAIKYVELYQDCKNVQS